MTLLHERIIHAGRCRGESASTALRHFLMEAVMKRLARLPQQGEFVLRGGMLTRAWVAPLPRPTRDLDLVGDFTFGVEETASRVRAALLDPLEDGVLFALASFRAVGIWLDTAFPGVRLTIPLGIEEITQELTLDVGFGDPLVPSATMFEYSPLCGEGFSLRACRPETQVAWKLHGLAEMGDSWRPKDLADIWRIARSVSLHEFGLADALVAAFHSRGFAPADAVTVLQRPHWASKTARVRWATVKGVPDLARTVHEVRAVLASAFDLLTRLPPPSGRT